MWWGLEGNYVGSELELVGVTGLDFLLADLFPVVLLGLLELLHVLVLFPFFLLELPALRLVLLLFLLVFVVACLLLRTQVLVLDRAVLSGDDCLGAHEHLEVVAYEGIHVVVQIHVAEGQDQVVHAASHGQQLLLDGFVGLFQDSELLLVGAVHDVIRQLEQDVKGLDDGLLVVLSHDFIHDFAHQLFRVDEFVVHLL